MGARAGDDSLRTGSAREQIGPGGRRSGGQMKQTLLQAIKQRPLLGDGAMGTQLMLAGLEQGNCGEEWNLVHPEKVLAIQRRYAEAGGAHLLTNTFRAAGGV